MIIENIHIDRFGALKDFDLTFKPDVTVICEENGYGKTTIAAFIEAMLYGLDNGNAKNDDHSGIRKKYIPWSIANSKTVSFGGSLTFSLDGKRYKIERTFGKTNKSDTIKVIDMATNKATNVFAGRSEIGEQIFGLDADSWRESLLLTSKPKNQSNLTEDMQKKLMNNDDIPSNDDSYNRAQEIIKKTQLSYTSDGKQNKGTRTIATNRRATLYTEKNKIENSEDALEVAQKEYEQCSATYLQINEQRKDYEKNKQAIQAEKDKLTKIKDESEGEYAMLVYQFKQWFPDDEPTYDDITVERKRLSRSAILFWIIIALLLISVISTVLATMLSDIVLYSVPILAIILCIVLFIIKNRKTHLEKIYSGDKSDITNEFLDSLTQLLENQSALAHYEKEIADKICNIEEMEMPNMELLITMTTRMSELQQEIKEHETAIARKAEIDMELAELNESIGTMDAKLRILDKVSHHLKCAEREMNQGYIPQARSILKDSLEKFAKSGFVSYDDDANVAVSASQKNGWYSISAGERDLVNICARKAIIECMFNKEAPMMILDDPLVNLDEDNIERGREIIREMAKDGQILYLTCHQDRLI